MFGVIRIIIGVVLGIWWLLIAPKITKIPLKRRTSITIIVLDILLITVLGFVPFENLVYTFESAESVYQYYSYAAEEVELVVEGEQCDLVLGKTKASSTLLLVPKASDGWKIGSGLNSKTLTPISSNGIFINIYHYKNTSDYFISVCDINGGELTISDEYNTAFLPLEENYGPYMGANITYYAHVADFDSQYSVTVNGNEIALKNQ